jgi:hypothetical protein
LNFHLLTGFWFWIWPGFRWVYTTRWAANAYQLFACDVWDVKFWSLRHKTVREKAQRLDESIYATFLNNLPPNKSFYRLTWCATNETPQDPDENTQNQLLHAVSKSL